MNEHSLFILILAYASILLVGVRLIVSIKDLALGYSMANVVFWCSFFCYILINPIIRVFLMPYEGFYELLYMRYPRVDLSDSYLIVLSSVCVFTACFNIRLPRFNPAGVSINEKYGRFLCLLLVPALAIAFWRYTMTIQQLGEEGYYAISHGLGNSKAWNIVSYTLPRLTVILIILTCRSAKLLIPALMSWMIMELFVLMSGPRSSFIYTAALVGVILYDRFLYNYLTTARMIGCLLVLGISIVAFSILTVSLRPGDITSSLSDIPLHKLFLQFAMPFDVARYMYIEAKHVSGVNGSFIFGYSYLCDVLSNVLFRNMCAPVTSTQYFPGFYLPALNFLDDPTGYLKGGMSGGSLIGSLLVPSTFGHWSITLMSFGLLSFVLSQVVNFLGLISGNLIKELLRFNVFWSIIKLPAHGFYIFIPALKFLAPVTLIAIALVTFPLIRQKVADNPLVKNRKRSQQDEACDGEHGR